MVHGDGFSRDAVEESIVPVPISYPKSGSVIKTSKRNPASVMAAVNAVNATAHAAGIAMLGGVTVVAAAISTAIAALAGASCTISGVMMKMMQAMMMMQKMQMTAAQNAVYAVLVKLT